MEIVFMTHLGEERINEIRYRFNPSMRVNFQGAKICSDTGILLVREIYEGLGESVFDRPSPTFWDGSPSPENEGNFLDDGFCDFAFRLRAE